MEKNKTALWRRLAYIVGTCSLLFIGVLILYGDKRQKRAPAVRMNLVGSAENTAASRISTQLSPEAEGFVDEFPSGKGSRLDAPFEVDAPSEAVGTATDMPSEILRFSDILVPSQEHTVQNNAANIEKEVDDPSILLQHKDVHEFMEDLAIEIKEKYPDIVELTSMSPEEILKKYPTESAIHALEERYLQYESEFIEDIQGSIHRLLLTEHVDDLVDVLLQMEKTLRENWGDEIAEKIMENMQKRMDLR